MTLGATSLAFAMLGLTKTAYSASPQPASADPDADTRQQHEDLTVLGHYQARNPKFTASLLDTPKSVSVISDALIRSTASTTLEEALRTVPGITFGAGEGGNPVGDRPFLRGFDTQSSTFLDNLRDTGSQSRETFNVDSIEVIKGDSGAFAGRGGAGGAIYINSKLPTLQNAANASLGFGTADYKRATLDINQVVAPTTAFRLNLMGHDAGVAERGPTHYRRYGIAPSLTWGLGTATRVTVMYYRLRSDNVPDSGIPYDNPNFTARTDGAPRILQKGGGAPIDVPQDTYYGLANRDFERDGVDMGTLRLEQDLNANLHLRNTTRYAETTQNYLWTQPDDSNGNIYYGYVWRRPNNRISTADTAINQTDFYGTFKALGLPNTFASGLEFARETSKNDTYNVATSGNLAATYNKCPASGLATYNCTTTIGANPYDLWSGTITRANNPNSTRTDTKAVYAFDTIALTRHFDLNLGGRYDNYDTRYIASRATGSDVRLHYGRTDNLFDYQAGLVYKPVRNGSIYVSYATSSTPTGNSAGQGSDAVSLGPDRTGFSGADLAPERNRTIEVGTKWNLLRQRLLLTLAAFQTETTNTRITQSDGTTALAGNSRVRGVEVGFNGAITDAWTITGGYTYLDPRLTKAGGSGAAFGLADGQQMPNVPVHSLSLWSTYAITRKLTAGGGAYYMDKVFGTAAAGAQKYVPAYWRFDVMASYTINKHYDLQLNIQNVANRRYFSQAYAAHYATEAPGRTALVTLNARL